MPDRVVAALTGEAEGEHVIRRAAQLAAASGAELVGVHVRSPSGHVGGEPSWLERQQRLLLALGGRYAEVAAVDVATAVLDFVRSEQAQQLVLGATRRLRHDEFLHGSVINQAITSAGAIEVHVIPARRPRKPLEPAGLRLPPPPRRVSLLRPSDGGWEIDDAEGVPVPRGPEDAQFTIELADRRLLAINGSRLQEQDAELLQALLTAVRQLRERGQADALTAE